MNSLQFQLISTLYFYLFFSFCFSSFGEELVMRIKLKYVFILFSLLMRNIFVESVVLDDA